MALAVPYRGANHRDALAGLRSSSCDHQVCDVEPRTYPRIVCEPVFGVASNTMYAHMCGVVKPSKKHQNPGTPRTRSLLSFTRDPGGLVQQHQAPVACFDEIKRGLPPLPNSSSHIREKLKRPTPTPILQTTGKESCRPALECSSSRYQLIGVVVVVCLKMGPRCSTLITLRACGSQAVVRP